MSDLTALDWIGVVLAALATLALLSFPLTVAPAFAGMFSEFGGPLPALTRLALLPWFAPLLALPPAAMLATTLGFRRAASIHERRALIVSSFVLGLGGNALCLAALYLPIFALAGSIKP